MKSGCHVKNSYFITLKDLSMTLRDLIMTLRDLFNDIEVLEIYLLSIYSHLICRYKCIWNIERKILLFFLSISLLLYF